MKRKPALSEQLYVCLTAEEAAQLAALATQLHPQVTRGAAGLVVRGLIREKYADLQESRQ
jgi:hypothetical protein